MKSFTALIGAAWLACALTSAAHAQSRNDITWDTPAAAAPLKKIDFQRIVMKIPSREPVGTSYGGIGCFTAATPIYVTRSGDLPVADYRQVFLNQLGASGHDVSQSESLFDHVEESQPELVAAAAIIGLKLKFCRGADLVTSRVHGTVQILVEWQILNPLERKIVFRGTTQGETKIVSEGETADMVALRAGFGEATKALLAMPEFQNIATKNASSAGAQITQAPPPTTIPLVPLSTTPFTQSAKSIEARVATVDLGVGHGSGFHISDELVLTNHHVASQGMMVKLRYPGGREAAGTVIVSNARRDVALIMTATTGTQGLPVRQADPDIGSQVYVIGSPLDIKLANTLSSGIVSAFRDMQGLRYIQSDVTIQPGNSGGPMFDDKGNVIGMSVSGRVQGGVLAGINFFIPIAEALTALGVTQQPAVASNTAKKTTKQ